MVDLAIHYGTQPISIKSISERQHISEYYLEQLFSTLRKSGLIKSIRGARGGYVLNRTPKEITVAEVMYVLEGPIEISDCLENGSCTNMECCATRLLWERVKNSLDSVLKSTTLSDMVNDYNNMRKGIKGVKINE